MHILYVGPLWAGSVCEQRKHSMEELGHKVYPIDTQTDYPQFGLKKIFYQMSYRMNYPLDLNNINRKILRTCNNNQFDLICIDKGQTVYPGTLKSLKTKMPRVTIVNINPDDPFCSVPRGWGWFKKCIPVYDVCFVPRNENLEEYKKNKAKQVCRFYWGYSPLIHKPKAVSSLKRKEMGGNVGFIGDYELERAQFLFYLAQNNIPVRIWGPNWKRKCRLSHPNMRIESRPLWGDEYARAICSFDINLGFLRKLNRDLQTTRSIEIPACGAFLLAERTSEHMELFIEGKEAEFFDAKEELLHKVHYYLEHVKERNAIAQSGMERCIKSGYSNHERMKEIMHVIQRIKQSISH